MDTPIYWQMNSSSFFPPIHRKVNYSAAPCYRKARISPSRKVRMSPTRRFDQGGAHGGGTWHDSTVRNLLARA